MFNNICSYIGCDYYSYGITEILNDPLKAKEDFKLEIERDIEDESYSRSIYSKYFIGIINYYGC